MRHPSAITLLVIASCLSGAAWTGSSEQEASNLLLNPGAELGRDDRPSIWYPAKDDAPGLRMWRDAAVAHGGKHSLAIANRHEYPQPVSNNWAQRLADIPAGRTVVLAAWIKTTGAQAANVCLQCWDKTGKMFAYTSTPVVRGDQDWKLLKSEPVVIPDQTATAVIRAALTGTGAAWFDDITLTVAPAPRPPDANGSATGDTAVEPELAKALGGAVVAVYPVVKDVMVLAYMPDWAHGSVDNIGVANNDGGARTLLACAPQQLNQSELSGNRFILALYARRTRSGTNPGSLALHAINCDWSEQTSWVTRPQVAEKPSACFDFAAGDGWKLFDVTDLVRQQATNPPTDHGVMLRFTQEDRRVEESSSYAFVSREGAGEWRSRRPILVMTRQATTTSRPKSRLAGD